MLAKSNPVYKSINKPLTVWGVERRLFFLAMIIGGATFTCFSSLAGAILMFFALYGCARRATKNDPQILRVLMNSSRFKPQYDPSKRETYQLEYVPGAEVRANR